MNYFDYQEVTNPLKGDLLISEPLLPDPNFERTVVLLCEHNEEGSFGFILNKPSLLKLSDVMELEIIKEELLYVGGPVQQDTLHFIHRQGELLEGSMEVGDGIYWGGNFEQMKIMLEAGQLNPNDFRFFLGYSGWSPGQLAMEIESKSWIIYRKANSRHVFETRPDIFWKQILNQMGGKYKMFANYPIDPRLN
jgi:putative transcriptional regulator